MVRYYYDAWGNHKIFDASGVEITDTAHIGHLNPIRYRSYYYDSELGFYYLKTRYYDPSVGRFITPDYVDYVDVDVVNGLNLYAYCNNNPAMASDPSGHKWYNALWDSIMTIVGFLNPISTLTAIGTLIVSAVNGKWGDVVDDWNNGCLKLFNQSEDTALKAKVLGFYKGTTIVRQNIVGTCSILGTIWAESDISEIDLRHEYGHSIQERFLGPLYLFTVAVPSVLYYWHDVKNNGSTVDYYSMPWERTADWFGGLNRGNYKKGSLAWGIVENLLGPIVIPFYYLFGY